MLNNKTILVTGGTGSFGKEFIKLVFEKYKPKKVIVFSRDELKQFEMQEDYPMSNKNFPIRYFIGDIRDAARLNMAFNGVDIVVHAAALKQVPATEYNPFEAVKTNILGTQNVINAAIENEVKIVLGLSTDKAAAPINLYGATKLTSDKLFISSNNYTGKNKTKFSVVRYGNVMGSRGSVIPVFLEKRRAKILPITHEEMTRFSITLEEGSKFVLDCIERMWGGEIFVPKIPSYRILDVAKAIDSNAKIKITGIRPGEKLHEIMITKHDSINTVEFDKYYAILPNSIYVDIHKGNYFDRVSNEKHKPCEPNFCYSSDKNENFLTVEAIKNLIIKNVPNGETIK